MPKILLVEDDKYLNKLLSDRLSLEGFQVSSVLDGETAWVRLLEATQHQAYEVLLLDMLLPRMMGAELLTKIRESGDFPDLKIHVMSGIYKDQQEVKDISELHSIQRYWTKPFQVDELIATLGQRKPEGASRRSLKGTLGVTSVERLLMNAYDSLFTGTLVLDQEESQRRIFFSNGFPVAADSTVLEERLGASLVLQGKITEAQRQEVARRMFEEQCQFGQMLTKMELLSPDQLFDALRKNAQRVILNCFALKEGKFEFQMLEALPDHIIHIEFNPILLILRAHKALYLDEFIRSLFDTKGDSFAHRSERFFQVLPLCNLDGASLQFFRDLPVDRDLSTLLQEISASKRDQFLRILYAMESIGVLEWKRQAAPIINRPASLDFKEAFEKQKDPSLEISTQLRSKYMEMIGQDFFAIFGISLDATEHEIKEAYRTKRYELHPDRFGPNLGGESKRILDDLMARIDHAYQIISHSQSRENYISQIDESRRDSAAQSKKFLEAQTLTHQGMALIEKSNFEAAKDCFERAAGIWNKSSEYLAYKYYCEIRIALRDHNDDSAYQSTQSLRKLARGRKASEVSLILLAQVLKVQDRLDEAREAYLEVLKISPNNKEASIALESLGGIKTASKDSTFRSGRLLKAALFGLMLAASGFGFYWAQTYWAPREDGTLLDFSESQSIIPTLKIRSKPPEAKIFTQEGWSADLPEAVLRSKCFQFVKEAKSKHGIERIYIYDTNRLVGFCSANVFRKFGQRN